MDVYLAVVALFAASGTFAMHASASAGSDSVPTPYDVAAATGQGVVFAGQGTRVAGQAGWLNFISADHLTDDQARLLYWRELTSSEQAGCLAQVQGARDKHFRDFDLAARSVAEEHLPPVEDLIPKHVPKAPKLTDAKIMDCTIQDSEGVKNAFPVEGYPPVQQVCLANVWLLTSLLIVVEGIAAGLFGFIPEPDRGEQLNSSKSRFSMGHAALGLALPDKGRWDSDSADIYGIDTLLLQQFAAAAGMDGGALSMGKSLATQVQDIIDDEATQVGLMQVVLTALALGLTVFIYRALWMESCVPGSSLAMQNVVALCTFFALAGVLITMLKWVDKNSESLGDKARQYRALAAAVPSSVPVGPPSAGQLPSAPTAVLFGQLTSPTSAARPADAKPAGAAQSGPSQGKTAMVSEVLATLTGSLAVADGSAGRVGPSVRPDRKPRATQSGRGLAKDSGDKTVSVAPEPVNVERVVDGSGEVGLNELTLAEHGQCRRASELVSHNAE